LAAKADNACGRCDTCAAREFWAGLYAVVNEYVDRFTLADLVRTAREKSGIADP
jgi:DNA-binding IscR family transcriptional regulator